MFFLVQIKYSFTSEEKYYYFSIITSSGRFTQVTAYQSILFQHLQQLVHYSNKVVDRSRGLIHEITWFRRILIDEVEPELWFAWRWIEIPLLLPGIDRCASERD